MLNSVTKVSWPFPIPLLIILGLKHVKGGGGNNRKFLSKDRRGLQNVSVMTSGYDVTQSKQQQHSTSWGWGFLADLLKSTRGRNGPQLIELTSFPFSVTGTKSMHSGKDADIRRLIVGNIQTRHRDMDTHVNTICGLPGPKNSSKAIQGTGLGYRGRTHQLLSVNRKHVLRATHPATLT